MEIIAGIVEGLISLVLGLIELIVGLFVEGAASLGAGEAIGLLIVLLIELIFWLIVFISELFISLIKWRRPKKIAKPIIWRPKKLNTENKSNEKE